MHFSCLLLKKDIDLIDRSKVARTMNIRLPINLFTYLPNTEVTTIDGCTDEILHNS